MDICSKQTPKKLVKTLAVSLFYCASLLTCITKTHAIYVDLIYISAFVKFAILGLVITKKWNVQIYVKYKHTIILILSL